MFRFTSKPMDIPTVDDNDNAAVQSPTSNNNKSRPRYPEEHEAAATAASLIISAAVDDDRHLEENVVVDIPNLVHEEVSLPLPTTTKREPSITRLSGVPTYDNLLDNNHRPPAAVVAAVSKPNMQASLHTTCSDASIEFGALLLANIEEAENKELESSTTRYESMIRYEDDDAAIEEDDDGVLNKSLDLHVSEMDISQLEEMESDFTIAPPAGMLVGNIEEEENEPEPATLLEMDSSSEKMAVQEEDIVFQDLIHAEIFSNDEAAGKARDDNFHQDNTILSFLLHYKGSILLFFIMTSVVRGMTNWLFHSPEIIIAQIHNNAIEVPVAMVPNDSMYSSLDVVGDSENDAATVMLGGYSYYVEEIPSSSTTVQGNFWWYASWQFLIVAAITKLILKKTFGTTTNQTSVPNADTKSCKDVGGMDQQQEMSSSDNDDSSVPSLVPVKSEGDDKVVAEYDLSNYHSMKLSELRDILRSKKCNYMGKKPKLIHRLATVYRSELQSLTVVQLRRKMKANQMPQGGLKTELVQQLVEAGLKKN